MKWTKKKRIVNSWEGGKVEVVKTILSKSSICLKKEGRKEGWMGGREVSLLCEGRDGKGKS